MKLSTTNNPGLGYSDQNRSDQEIKDFAEKWGLNPDPIEPDPKVIFKPGAETDEECQARRKKYGLYV